MMPYISSIRNIRLTSSTFNVQNVKSHFWTREHNIQFARYYSKRIKQYIELHTQARYQIDVKSKSTVYSSHTFSSSTTAGGCKPEAEPKSVLDRMPVPQSSISLSFCEGARVDVMDGRGTVEAEGESSGPRGLFRADERLAAGSA